MLLLQSMEESQLPNWGWRQGPSCHFVFRQLNNLSCKGTALRGFGFPSCRFGSHHAAHHSCSPSQGHNIRVFELLSCDFFSFCLGRSTGFDPFHHWKPSCRAGVPCVAGTSIPGGPQPSVTTPNMLLQKQFGPCLLVISKGLCPPWEPCRTWPRDQCRAHPGAEELQCSGPGWHLGEEASTCLNSTWGEWIMTYSLA